jgi:dipeptidyl aminopeptidase/acylaminoacyl peptidase
MTPSRLPVVLIAGLCLISAASVATAERRLVTAADLARLAEVEDPQLSPDGEWVAYAVRSADLKKDALTRDIWMSNWRSGKQVRLTSTPENEGSPRWSPDGQRLGFLSSRGDKNEATQLWLLNIAGGEAERVTDLKGSIEDYAFAPDGKRVALIVSDADPGADEADDPDQTAPPIVIDRYYFKEDETGYLGEQRRHLYLLDLASRTVQPLTPGQFEEVLPSWSPNGRQIAFASKRGADPDRNDTFGIYVIDAHAGAEPRLVVEYEGEGADTEWASAAHWSPDGKQLAYVAGHDPKLTYYTAYGINTVAVTGGTPRSLTTQLDRNTFSPQWSADGRYVYCLLEDDGNQQLARVPAAGGELTLLSKGRQTVEAFSADAGHLALLQSTVERPNEIFALEAGKLRQLSRQNDAWLAEVQLGSVDEIRATSPDGTVISGFLVKPPGRQNAQKLPTLLRIHGGPVSQFSNAFMFEWQLFAAQGYAVVAGNPRGSSGRGEAFAAAIFADWGNKDTHDVLALVDRVVAMGVADPERLGVGGWSYGGILTNYVIASDPRFKAATSGASISNVLAGYGTDMYIREYEVELGLPWQNTAAWERISFPFLHADRISTPTLFLCGDADFNVPLLNSEQMYQALRSRQVPTQLIIYPGQSHGLDKPSYRRDRLERYLAWYAKFLR